MALADFAAYQAAVTHPHQVVEFAVPSLSGLSFKSADLFPFAVPVGVAPTTAVVPTRTTAGALDIQNAATTLGVCGARVGAMYPGTYVLCDRLSHQGGLSGTTTGAQTTNLPTSALTRYTSGEGVMCMLTIYTQVGATATTATVSYTNQAGTSGRTSPLVAFGGTANRESRRGVLIPTAVGDTGFQAVASVTLAATTATAGNFGVTLFKPLCAVVVDETPGNEAAGLIAGSLIPPFVEIVDDACLFLLGFPNTNLAASGAFLLTEW